MAIRSQDHSSRLRPQQQDQAGPDPGRESDRTRRTLPFRRTLLFIFIALSLPVMAPETAKGAAMSSARLVKVLPHFVDKQGRVALSPSLYERDAYQAHLRKNPSEQGGMRFDVQWKSSTTNRFTLRLELRGNKDNIGTSLVLEQQVKYTGFFSTWSRADVGAEAKSRLGDVSAWRATLWEGQRLVAEQKSFLW